jgi:FKBP-type peptidyl-prolyl cis-trans isomerase FkpA
MGGFAAIFGFRLSLCLELHYSKLLFMLKSLVCGLIGSILFISCLKKDNGCSYSDPTASSSTAEQTTLKSYLDSIGTVATLNPHGFYYSVEMSGEGQTPGQCSQITVAYKGWLTSGVSFDQQSSIAFTSLGSLIDGWREGIPLIKQGGKIRLYIPPSLGYGAKGITDNSGNTVVPPNSIIIFDITLITVQ